MSDSGKSAIVITHETAVAALRPTGNLVRLTHAVRQLDPLAQDRHTKRTPSRVTPSRHVWRRHRAAHVRRGIDMCP